MKSPSKPRFVGTPAGPEPTPDVVVSIYGVTVEGVFIPRPSRSSISQWMDFWERVKRIGYR